MPDGFEELMSSGAPEPPEAWLLYQRLRLWANNGTIPFPTEGGFMDQPRMAMLMLEICMKLDKAKSDGRSSL